MSDTFQCPICPAVVRFGTQRCPEGHWIWWKKSGSSYTLELRTAEVIWPQKAQCRYDGCIRQTPGHDGAEIGTLKENDKAVIVNRQGDWYALEKGGWVFHNQVALFGQLPEATVVSPLSDVQIVNILDAPAWPGPGTVRTVKVGKKLTIWERIPGWSRVGNKSEWIADMWLKFSD